MSWWPSFAQPSRVPDAGATPPRPQRALLRRLEVTARKQLAGALAGEFRSRLRGRGMEFAGLRPYLPGDEVRQIDWNVTARTGTPHLRLYQEERSRSLTLLADLSPSLTPTLRTLLLETSALLAFAAVQSRDRLGLVAFSDRVERLVPPAPGRNQALRILSDLERRHCAGRGSDPREALETALALNRRPGLLLILSDGHLELPAPLLRRAAGRHDLVFLQLRDPAQRRLPGHGLLRVADAESGRQRLLDLASATARTAIAEHWQASDRALAATLAGLGIDHAVLDCGQPVLPVLLRLFRRRGGR